MTPVLLWSDALLFLLLLSVMASAWWSRRQDHLRLAWARVAENGVAMAAATLLAAFVLVGTLDSLHYRAALPVEEGKPAPYAVEVTSALDALLMPLKTRMEKTYSAPLAARLFAKESLEGEAGRDFPRLRYGGVHLGDDLAAAPYGGVAVGLEQRRGLDRVGLEPGPRGCARNRRQNDGGPTREDRQHAHELEKGEALLGRTVVSASS